MKNKVEIIINLEKNDHGTVGRTLEIKGEGFHYYELVGLVQMACYDIAKMSLEEGEKALKSTDTLPDKSPTY